MALQSSNGVVQMISPQLYCFIHLEFPQELVETKTELIKGEYWTCIWQVSRNTPLNVARNGCMFIKQLLTTCFRSPQVGKARTGFKHLCDNNHSLRLQS